MMTAIIINQPLPWPVRHVLQGLCTLQGRTDECLFTSAQPAAWARSDLRTVCQERLDRKSTRLNSSHLVISYAVFCLKKKKQRSRNNTIIQSSIRCAPVESQGIKHTPMT